MNRRYLMITCIICVFLFCLTGCKADVNGNDNGRIKVIATLFPQYDFARAIGGEYADVTLLLPPGMESHSYDLRPDDMITISNSDVFIYTGKYMETWASQILDSLSNNITVVDVSTGIELVKDEHDHDHEGDDEDVDDHEGHIHEYDPHIWTNPVYAVKMCETIRDAFIELDPEHSDYYISNATGYIMQLQEIDEEFRDITDSANKHTIYFGGKFAMTYFAREYGLTCVAAFSDCSSESEPTIKRVMTIIDEVNEHGARAVFYEELTDPKVAKTIAEETGAELLLLHSAHNVSKADFNSGITYIDIMKANAVNLRKALGE